MRSQRDFEFTSHGSVWSIRAVSDEAKDFAEENFAVEGWQGAPHYFMTDHRAARALIRQLHEEGWNCRYHGRID